jgi:hypothetical protein
MPKGNDYNGSTWQESRERVNETLERLEERQGSLISLVGSINLRLSTLEAKSAVYGSIGGLVVGLILHFLTK